MYRASIWVDFNYSPGGWMEFIVAPTLKQVYDAAREEVRYYASKENYGDNAWSAEAEIKDLSTGKKIARVVHTVYSGYEVQRLGVAE